jgi:flavodoxin
MNFLIDADEEGDPSNSRRAIVIFDTRYGNTEKIARSLEGGLKQVGIQTDCVSAKEVNLPSLREYDLIVLGAPTEWLTASKLMKDFLESLKGMDLSEKYGFAFDTKLSRPMSGSAAKLIEKELKRHGIRVIADRESATVFLQSGSITGAWLKDGEEKKFEEIGRRIGMALPNKAITEAIAST